MRGSKLTRPPGWAIAALVVLVAANALVLALLHHQDPVDVSPAGTVPAAVTTMAPSVATGARPTPPQTPASTPAAPGVLTVYGDGYAAGNEQGGAGPSGWPAVVAAETNLGLTLHAASRVGYVSVGVTGQDLDDLVDQAPPTDARVTILFGSRNDRGEDPSQVQAQAARAIAAVLTAAPRTQLVVIGPVWSDSSVPPDLLMARDAVQAAAQAAGVTFVDPLTAGWLASGSDLIATDGVSPTDAGHAELARRIVPIVRAALDRTTPLN